MVHFFPTPHPCTYYLTTAPLPSTHYLPFGSSVPVHSFCFAYFPAPACHPACLLGFLPLTALCPYTPSVCHTFSHTYSFLTWLWICTCCSACLGSSSAPPFPPPLLGLLPPVPALPHHLPMPFPALCPLPCHACLSLPACVDLPCLPTHTAHACLPAAPCRALPACPPCLILAAYLPAVLYLLLVCLHPTLPLCQPLPSPLPAGSPAACLCPDSAFLGRLPAVPLPSHLFYLLVLACTPHLHIHALPVCMDHYSITIWTGMFCLCPCIQLLWFIWFPLYLYCLYTLLPHNLPVLLPVRSVPTIALTVPACNPRDYHHPHGCCSVFPGITTCNLVGFYYHHHSSLPTLPSYLPHSMPYYPYYLPFFPPPTHHHTLLILYCLLPSLLYMDSSAYTYPIHSICIPTLLQFYLPAYILACCFLLPFQCLSYNYLHCSAYALPCILPLLCYPT